MIEPSAREHIVRWLHRVEAEEGAHILFAAESGSRAWGFASPDSDYDVRFVYAHPRDWYLQLSDTRDVIERALDAKLVDLSGWDVRKALQLLLKSNPPLYEWLCSPIIYLDDGVFREAAKSLFQRHASPVSLARHYHNIAKGQWSREIDGRDQVRLKKYFYVLRPLLSLQWIADGRGTPPMHIDALLAGSEIPPPVRQAFADLLALKQGTPELGLRARVGVIDDWALERTEALDPARLHLPQPEQMATRREADRLLLATLDRLATPQAGATT